jgi:ParB family chromosome partitioning protein
MTMRERPQTNQPNSKRSALGKGITSLLGGVDIDVASNAPVPAAPKVDFPLHPPAAVPTLPVDGQILRLRVGDIEPNPQQPRKLFDDQLLKDLAASLKEDGLLQPVVVTKSDEKPGRYILIAGERRWRASQMAGLREIPAIVKEGASHDLLRLALIENIQRADLNIIEEAEAYQSLIKDYGLTQEQCAERVGKDRTTVTNALRLLVLPREIQDDLLENRLTMGHGRALLSLDDKKLMLRARDIVIKKQMSVRQTEQFCKTFKDASQLGEKSTGVLKNKADLEYLADSLRSHLKTKVRVTGNGSRGKIEVSYFSASELERLLAMIGQRFT